ncbi:MAG: transposase [Nostocaceae cyanobacterium]|nr:transposase [Nostocaceae cyanobacterium]
MRPNKHVETLKKLAVKYDPDIHHRRSIRLRGYDYSQENAYFVTICTQHRECCLGDVINSEMKFTIRGKITHQLWLQITHHFPNVELDEFIVMPNHIHGIIVIVEDNCRGGVSPSHTEVGQQKHGVSPSHTEVGQQKHGMSPIFDILGEKGGETPPLRKQWRPTLGQIVAYYKYQTTKIINQIDNTPGNRIWQRNYYEHIIRDGKSLENIRQYIRENPGNWGKDLENPQKIL